ncbi:hypothetical protein L1049_026187 [Liquidambar formosana]|uniref:Major facilitator superfamily (MFS) profile domain-containing protein n=1 Tax=Liquidambar formosana TaxID=63359 RepID=A0AAP0NF14_LIQFO
MALKLLSALDRAKPQYYHFKAIIIAGMGLFTDAYDFFCLAPLLKLLGRIYYDHESGDKRNEIPAPILSTMLAIAPLGSVIGQIVFGRLGDRMGRRHVYGLALMLMVLSSIGCGMSIGTTRTSVLMSLGIFRFLLGVGIGGDYPLSATIMAECANKRMRGAFIAAVFSMQGLGILASSGITMLVTKIFIAASNPKGEKTPAEADLVWRIILMLGAIPAGMTFYWRMTMPETASSSVSMASISSLVPPHGFLSTSSFIAATSSRLRYPPSFNVPDEQHMNAYEDAFQVARLQAITAVCATIPGYWATVFFIDRIGRVKIQMYGFFFMAIGFFAIGIPYNYWENNAKKGFMVLYFVTFFFSNFGPNTTTFIVPAELFPARFRTTCHGISGAAGKVGAIIGSVGFQWVSDHLQKASDHPKGTGTKYSLVILGGICIMGMIVTFFFTRETMGISLEENEKDDQLN